MKTSYNKGDFLWKHLAMFFGWFSAEYSGLSDCSLAGSYPAFPLSGFLSAYSSSKWQVLCCGRLAKRCVPSIRPASSRCWMWFGQSCADGSMRWASAWRVFCCASPSSAFPLENSISKWLALSCCPWAGISSAEIKTTLFYRRFVWNQNNLLRRLCTDREVGKYRWNRFALRPFLWNIRRKWPQEWAGRRVCGSTRHRGASAPRCFLKKVGKYLKILLTTGEKDDTITKLLKEQRRFLSGFEKYKFF